MTGSFWRLYRKELAGLRPTLVMFGAGIVGWELFIMSRRPLVPSDLTWHILGALPLMALPVLALATGFGCLQSEWASNTILLLLGLPVRGVAIVAAKAAAGLTMLGGLAALTLSLTGGFLVREIARAAHAAPISPGVAVVDGLKASGVYLLFLGMLMAAGQVAYIAGRMVEKRRGLMSAAVLLWEMWLVVRVGGLLKPLLGWIPDLKATFGGAIDLFTLADGASVTAVALVMAGLTCVAAWLLEHEIDA